MLLDRIVAWLSEMTNVKPHSTCLACLFLDLEHEGMGILLAVCLTFASLHSHFFCVKKWILCNLDWPTKPLL